MFRAFRGVSSPPDNYDEARMRKLGVTATPNFVVWIGNEAVATGVVRDQITGTALTVGAGVSFGIDSEGPYAYFNGTSTAYMQFSGQVQSPSDIKLSIMGRMDIDAGWNGMTAFVSKGRDDDIPNYAFSLIANADNDYAYFRFPVTDGLNAQNITHHFPFVSYSGRPNLFLATLQHVAPLDWKIYGWSTNDSWVSVQSTGGFAPASPNPARQNAVPLLIGAHWINLTTRGRFFKGKLRWLAIYPEVFAAPAVHAHSRARAPIWRISNRKVDPRNSPNPNVSRTWYVSPHTFLRSNWKELTSRAYEAGEVVYMTGVYSRVFLLRALTSGFGFSTKALNGVDVGINITGGMAMALPDRFTMGSIVWENVTGTSMEFAARTPQSVAPMVVNGDVIIIDEGLEAYPVRPNNTQGIDIGKENTGIAGDLQFLEHFARGRKIRILFRNPITGVVGGKMQTPFAGPITYRSGRIQFEFNQDQGIPLATLFYGNSGAPSRDITFSGLSCPLVSSVTDANTSTSALHYKHCSFLYQYAPAQTVNSPLYGNGYTRFDRCDGYVSANQIGRTEGRRSTLSSVSGGKRGVLEFLGCAYLNTDPTNVSTWNNGYFRALAPYWEVTGAAAYNYQYVGGVFTPTSEEKATSREGVAVDWMYTTKGKPYNNAFRSVLVSPSISLGSTTSIWKHGFSDDADITTRTRVWNNSPGTRIVTVRMICLVRSATNPDTYNGRIVPTAEHGWVEARYWDTNGKLIVMDTSHKLPTEPPELTLDTPGSWITPARNTPTEHDQLEIALSLTLPNVALGFVEVRVFFNPNINGSNYVFAHVGLGVDLV